MVNEQLRSAMATANIDINALSKTIEVDTKTVQRWL